MMFLANFDTAGTYACGVDNFYFPGMLPYAVNFAITVIKIAIPIILIVFGMLDLGKAVVASKEDEIKKGQQMFIKRLIAAVIVFFVTFVVQIVIRFVTNGDNAVMRCLNCFVNGKLDVVDSSGQQLGCETR